MNGTEKDLILCYNFLIKQGFESRNIHVVSDYVNIPNVDPFSPTKDKIEKLIQLIVQYLKGRDTVFFQFSGHGLSMNANTDEHMECICPVDYQTKGLITDDWM